MKDLDEKVKAINESVKERDRLALSVTEMAQQLSSELAKRAKAEGGIDVYRYFNYWIEHLASKLPIKRWVSHLALAEAIGRNYSRYQTVRFDYLDFVDCGFAGWDNEELEESGPSEQEVEADAMGAWAGTNKSLRKPDNLKVAIIALMEEGIGGFVNDW